MQPDEVIEAPLYLQVATRVKHQIASGKLREGDRLPSLREGANRWRVNLHTVRKAYAVLEADGLVRTHHRSGTRVAASLVNELRSTDADLKAYIETVLQTASVRFGVGAAELARRLTDAVSPSGPVWVLECSVSLAKSLADQIAQRCRLEVRPCVLRKGLRIPDGIHLSTYYHFAEVRRALADRAWQPLFFGVRIEKENLARMAKQARRAGRLALLAVDAASGGAIASELSQELKGGVPIDLRVTHRPRIALRQIPELIPVLVTPQNWDRLSDDDRRSRRVFPLTLQPDKADLERIADTLKGGAPTAARSDPSANTSGAPRVARRD